MVSRSNLAPLPSPSADFGPARGRAGSREPRAWLVDLNDSIASACSGVPGLIRASLSLLPDGLLLGGIGPGGAFEHEPLVRSAALCFSTQNVPISGDRPAANFVEYVFVLDDRLIVIQAGQRDARLMLAIVCTREANLALALHASRDALRRLESTVDLTELGVGR